MKNKIDFQGKSENQLRSSYIGVFVSLIGMLMLGIYGLIKLIF